MLNLSPEIHGRTYAEVQPILPLRSAFEFMVRPIVLDNDLELDFQRIARTHRENNWNFDMHRVKMFMRNPAHSVVLTDAKERIQLVTQGFERMTGYQRADVFRKSPKMLQGERTDEGTRREIKACIKQHEAFQGRILNYRKNGDTYWCNVEIEPIFDENRKIVNYIAFEFEK
jgi:PAS domain S-box-containing protein